MRAVRLNGNASVAIADVELPAPGPGQVLIRTAISALCGSELSTYRGKGSAQGNTGHEAAGIVERLGEGVAGLKEGRWTS